MSFDFQHSATPTFTMRQPSERGGTTAISYEVVQIPTSSGSTTPVTVDDVIYDRETGGSSEPVVFLQENGILGGSFSVDSEAVATLSGSTLTYVSDGTVTVTWTDPTGSVKQDIAIADVSGGTVDTWSANHEDSLAYHCAAQIDAMLSGKTASSTTLRALDTNYPALHVTRNSSLWCASISDKLTCCSHWNNRSQNKRTATAISSYHVIFAIHYDLKVGDKVWFLTDDGVVVERTIAGRAKVYPNGDSSEPVQEYDLMVATLNSALPATITPAKLLPDDFEDKFTNNSGLGAICVDQEEKVLVMELANTTTLNGGLSLISFASAALAESGGYQKNTAWYDWMEEKVGGDSSSPVFLVVDGELVLVTCLSYGGGGTGFAACEPVFDIVTACASADTAAGITTGVTPSKADFSAFDTY